ncbi:MAG TPA: hypothetical protein PLD10_15820 [Rhodopila sp.]|nr:hypothetical protein [Rhodopila sp.]
MNTDPAEAAEALASVLMQENDALRRLDLPAAVALVSAKQAAVNELQGAPPYTMTPRMAALAQRLHTLAADNHGLLERAIRVQAQVIQVVASACRPPPGTLCYGRSGTPAAAPASAVALSTRA